jgi:hypothetical protein
MKPFINDHILILDISMKYLQGMEIIYRRDNLEDKTEYQ